MGEGGKGNQEKARLKNEANRVSVRESCLEDYDLGFDS